MVRSREVSTEFLILGSIEARSDGGPLELQVRGSAPVLAVLLLHTGEVVPATTLIYDTWGETSPGRATSLLQGYVSDLRKSLGRHTMRHARSGLRARHRIPRPRSLHRFERLVAAAPTARSRRSRRSVFARRWGSGAAAP